MYPMPPTPQIPPYAPTTSLLSRGMIQGGAQQLGQLPLQQGVMGQMGQSGGFLAKLLGGAKAGGGGLTNIMGMLQNAQKAVGVFQQFAPLVQQYGPLVKSLPALISIMRNSDDSSEPEEQDANPTEVKNNDKKKSKKKTKSSKNGRKNSSNSSNKKQINSKRKTTKKSKRVSTPPQKRTDGIPAPKLYI